MFPGKGFFGLGPVGTAVLWWHGSCSLSLVPIIGNSGGDHQYDDDHSPQRQQQTDMSYLGLSFFNSMSASSAPEKVWTCAIICCMSVYCVLLRVDACVHALL